jgi:TonB family protein
MDVTDILRSRMHQPPGLQRMAALSTLIHGAILAMVVLAPAGLFSPKAPPFQNIMTISLGEGSPGPQNGGITNIGGRAIQAEKPPDAPREAVRPPAVKTPEMTVPTPKAKPLPRPSETPVKEAPDEARGRTPTRGAEPTPGSAVAATGVRGQGFGLSMGGGTGSGSRLDISGDFCCPDYILLMLEKIRSNWNQRVDAAGVTVVAFTIQRDGRLTNFMTERSSGYLMLDNNALRAVALTRQLPALPEGYTNPTLGVHLNFDYTR